MIANAVRTIAFALVLAGGVAGLPAVAHADDSINQVNDSQVQQRQMDFYRNYVFIQDQVAQSVGSRSATMVVPAPWFVIPAPLAVAAVPMAVVAPPAARRPPVTPETVPRQQFISQGYVIPYWTPINR